MLCSIVLPPNVIEESISITKLQRFILENITDDSQHFFINLEKNFILENSSFQQISKLVITIVEMANIRSMYYDLFSTLLIQIFEKYNNKFITTTQELEKLDKNTDDFFIKEKELEENKQYYSFVMNTITETVLRAFFGTIYPKAPFHFLRVLLNTCLNQNSNLITGNSIAKCITEFISNEYKEASSFNIVLLFSLFCPELEINSPETYTKMKEKYEIEVQQKTFEGEYSDLFEDVDSTLRANSWSLQKRLCRHKGKFKSLSWYIRRDEWQQVKNIVTKPGFSKLEPLKLSIFEPPVLKSTSLLASEISVRKTLPTPLEYSAFYGAEKTFEFLLLSHGGSHLSYRAKSNKIWEYACSACTSQISKKIIDLLKQKKFSTKSAIHASIFYHRSDMFDYLLTTESIDVTVVDPIFGSMLHSASSTSNINVLLYCIENGFDVNTPDDEGRTCLHIACEFCNHTVCKILLECKGIDVNAVNKAGQTCLHIACINGDLEMFNLLADHGCLIDKQDKNMRTALHEAAERNKIDIVDCLIQRKANLNLKCNFGWTALHLAVKSSNSVIIAKLLVLKEIDTTIVDAYGETAFMLASPQLRDCKILEPFRSYFVRENTKKRF